MSDLSPRLALPFLQPAQAQKHVTHNEALQRLDILVQLSVEAFGAVDPPEPEPADGLVWALGAAPTGEWGGQAGMLAARIDGGWQFMSPQDGWSATERNSGRWRIWHGGSWQGPVLADLPGLGINTGPDGANPLAVAGPATLLTHQGAGHQLKINKATAGDTASLLFQTGWSGRAEFGLAGSDNFSVKVSPDGSTWRTALTVGRADGIVDLATGATVGGQPVLRRGDMLGSVSQSGGLATGAVFERGSNAGGDYIRFADGTQICMATLNLGSALALGAGTFENQYRTNIQTWTYPAAFAVPPLIAGSGTIASSVGNARRMVLSFRYVTTTSTDAIQAFRIGSDTTTSDCTAYMMAIGRWF